MSGAFTIASLGRDPEHNHWTATLDVDGEMFEADRRFGSWQVVLGERRRHLLPHVALVLQQRVRQMERRGRIASDACGEGATSPAGGTQGRHEG